MSATPDAPPPRLADALALTLAPIAATILPFVIATQISTERIASVDRRYALVVGTALLLLAALRARSSSGRDRILAAVLAVAAWVAMLASRTALLVAPASILLIVEPPLAVARGLVGLARTIERRAARIAVIAVVVLSALGPWITLSWGLAETQLVSLVRIFHSTLDAEGEEREVRFATTDDLELRATYSPGLDGAGAVLLLHGRADARDRMSEWARTFAARGLHALRIDFRAQGRSDGAVVTYCDGERDDARAALAWLRSEAGVDPSHVMVLGTSMGGGVALSLADLPDEERPRAIVALAPASDYRAIVGRVLAPLGPFAAVPRMMVRGVSHAFGHTPPVDLVPVRALDPSPRLPVLLVHGDADRTIPLALSERVAERPGVGLIVLPGVGHDDVVAAAHADPDARRMILALAAD